uniref:Cyclin-like domain-containing protein n=1 Tax=Chromera velia CCMP2878 TaxID=1169474 RepID=A0A0G4HCC0_9ALVE|eukprot:Cvel_6262.t1-p1 / transcript=Cvel_6262.t1 / gene=Cvel_6262 / organism=Chromera_velia_CCMP2878 / gene_product=Cyclin-B2-1, putative / transcript_product=Cyclin-B2-1, putative / location=Cvel_scaffold303:71535-80531(+) / protein_length=496 / sequence_SO=supercontig / SO=protein_coding / is_pseudo=false
MFLRRDRQAMLIDELCGLVHAGKIRDVRRIRFRKVLPKLEQLEALGGVLGCGGLEGLEALELTGEDENKETGKGALAIFQELQQKKAPTLKVLKFSDISLGHNGARSLAGALESGGLSELTELEMGNAGIDAESVVVISEQLERGKAPNLSSLNLSKNKNVGAKGIRELAKALESRNLRQMMLLVLSDCESISLEGRQRVRELAARASSLCGASRPQNLAPERAVMKGAKPADSTPVFHVPSAPPCGVDRPSVPIPQCDVEHLTDPGWFVHYVKGIQRDQKPMERDFLVSPATHPAWSRLDGDVRAVHVGWMIHIHASVQSASSEESLYLAVNLMDRYLGKRSDAVSERESFLTAVTCLFLAFKFEDAYPPEAGALVWMSNCNVTRTEIFNKEVEILNDLQFKMTFPTPYTFMLRYANAVGLPDKFVAFCQYLIELLLHSKEVSTYKPSRIAAAAVQLTCRIFKADFASANILVPSYVDSVGVYARWTKEPRNWVS